MIARTWRGTTKRSDAPEYAAYLRETGFVSFESTPGNVGALGLVRLDGDRAEFLVLSLWDSPEAIRRFAGDRLEQAVFYPDDAKYLIERDETVSHFEVVIPRKERWWMRAAWPLDRIP